MFAPFKSVISFRLRQVRLRLSLWWATIRWQKRSQKTVLLWGGGGNEITGAFSRCGVQRGSIHWTTSCPLCASGRRLLPFPPCSQAEGTKRLKKRTGQERKVGKSQRYP